MESQHIDEGRIKALFKEALIELLEERKDLLQDAVAEALEDFALGRAMKEAEDSESVDRETVMEALRGSYDR